MPNNIMLFLAKQVGLLCPQLFGAIRSETIKQHLSLQYLIIWHFYIYFNIFQSFIIQIFVKHPCLGTIQSLNRQTRFLSSLWFNLLSNQIYERISQLEQSQSCYPAPKCPDEIHQEATVLHLSPFQCLHHLYVFKREG